MNLFNLNYFNGFSSTSFVHCLELVLYNNILFEPILHTYYLSIYNYFQM